MSILHNVGPAEYTAARGAPNGGMQSLFSDTTEDGDLRPNRLGRKQLGWNTCGGGTGVKRFQE